MASLREYIKDLNIWRRKNTLQTSDDIEVYSNSNGMTSLRLIKDLGIIGSSSTQSEYTGYFKVVKIDDTHVKVVDSLNESSAYCGYVNAGYDRVNVPRADSLAIVTGTVNYVYIEYNTGTAAATMKIAAALPVNTQSYDNIEAATVNITDSKIDIIFQRLAAAPTIVRWV